MKKIILLILVVCSSFQIFAQHEVGVSLGATNLLGDFGGGPGVGTIFVKDIDLKSTRPSAGLFYRYNFAKRFAARVQFLYGSFYGNDLYSQDKFRFARGLISKATLLDGSLQLEFNFIPLKFCSNVARVSPYVAIGIGVSTVNAKVTSATPVAIESTENQYLRTGSIAFLNVPISFGLKYKTKGNFAIALEGSYRVAFTDRLDNYVRQQNDHFLVASVHVSYVFCRTTKGFRTRTKCPTFR